MCLEGKCPPPGKTCNDGNAVAWDGCTDGDLTEFLVNSFTEDWQIDPVVAAISTGAYMVVWTSKFEDGDGQGVFARRFKADSTPAGPAFQVNEETEDNQERPAVAPLDAGYAVAWESWGQDGVGDGIVAQVFKSDGSKKGAEFVVNDETMGDQTGPAVTAMSGGGFIVLWEGTSQADWKGVNARVFDAGGKPSGPQFAVNQTTAGEQRNPTAALLEDGRILVAWESELQDGDGLGVFARLLDSVGAPSGDELQVNSYTPLSQQDPTVVPLPGGGFAILWQSAGQDSSGFGIVGAVFDAGGAVVQEETLLNDWTSGNQEKAAVAAVGDGFVAAWASKEQDGDDYGIFLRLVPTVGAWPGQPEFQANVFTTSIQASPALAALPGSFVLVWKSWEQGCDGYDIFAARFDQSGNMLYH